MMKGMLGDLMKQAQKVQEDMKDSQEKMAAVSVNGESGGGMAKGVMTGRYEIKKVTLDDSLMDDREMLEDLVAAAMNDAVRKIEKLNEDNMSGMLGGMNLPAGFKLPGT